jgi:hypothetical protein
MVKYCSTSTTETYNVPLGQNRLFKFTIKLNQDEKLLKGSIKVSGKLKVFKAGASPIVLGDNVFYDAQIGVHSLFNLINTSVTSKDGKYSGMIENLTQYPMIVKMFNVGNKHYNNQMASNKNNTELVCGSNIIAQNVLLGQTGVNRVSDTSNDFMFAPMICVNRTANDVANLQQIDIQFTINDLYTPFYTSQGRAFPAGFNWTIENLKCHYVTMPCTVEEMKTPLTYAKIIESNRTVLISSNGMYNFTCPSNCVSILSVFQLQGKGPTENQLYLDYVPDIQKLEYTINGQTGSLKFILQSEEEIRANAIRAVNLQMSESNALFQYDSFMIGYNFLGPLPKNTEIGMNIVAGSGYSGNYNMLNILNCVETI